MTFALLNMITWIPLVIVFILSRSGIAPAWLAALWMINIAPGILLAFQKDNWISNIVPGRIMGRYLGQRLAIKSGFFLAAFLLFGYLMDSIGVNNPAGFGLVFLAATVMTFVYFFIYTFMHGSVKKEPLPLKEPAPGIKFGLLDYIANLKQKKLEHFVLFTSLINVTIGFSSPFFAVYMLREQNFTYLSYTIIIAAEFLARVISGPFWGRFADKEGNIKVLKIASRIIPAIPVCWLFSTNIGYLAAIQIVSGICWGAFDLSAQSYLYKVAPPKMKLRYIVYTRSLLLFSVALGGLAGSFLIKDIFPVFGSRLLSIFMISGFLRALIVMFLIPKLIDMAVIYNIPKAFAYDLKLVKSPADTKRGLFYRQPAPQPVKSNIITAGALASLKDVRARRRNPEMEARLAGMYKAKRDLAALTESVRVSGGRNPAVYEKKIQVKRELEKAAIITPLRRPRYRDDAIRITYNLRASAMAASALKAKAPKPARREGLFYNGDGWARYMMESTQAIIREKEAYKAAVKIKPGFTVSRRPVTETWFQSGLSSNSRLALQKQPVIA